MTEPTTSTEMEQAGTSSMTQSTTPKWVSMTNLMVDMKDIKRVDMRSLTDGSACPHRITFYEYPHAGGGTFYWSYGTLNEALNEFNRLNQFVNAYKGT